MPHILFLDTGDSGCSLIAAAIARRTSVEDLTITGGTVTADGPTSVVSDDDFSVQDVYAGSTSGQSSGLISSFDDGVKMDLGDLGLDENGDDPAASTSSGCTTP